MSQTLNINLNNVLSTVITINFDYNITTNPALIKFYINDNLAETFYLQNLNETNIYSFGVLTTQTTYNLKAIITDLSNQEIIQSNVLTVSTL